jgi:mannose-6-phosphate isomerase-like protein (cupin superfamily)
MEFRRVVTAVDENGSSVCIEDDVIEPVEIAATPDWRYHFVWGHDELPVSGRAKPAAVNMPFFPAEPTAEQVAAAPVPPEEETAAALAQAEETIPGLLGVFEPDAPGFHTTQSVDYDFVIEGELHLELDNGELVRLPTGTCVVQNGGRHEWRNPSGKPATLLYVLLGARPTSEAEL